MSEGDGDYESSDLQYLYTSTAPHKITGKQAAECSAGSGRRLPASNPSHLIPQSLCLLMK